MMRSGEIGKLAAALAAAQGAMEKARRSGRNDHFRSRYPTLDDLLEVAKASLSQHGLAFTQCTGTEPGAGIARVTTTLLHESGEWMGSELEYPVEGNVQQLGGVFTYLKRQALSSMLGISCDPDDDGEGDRITKGGGDSQADANPAPRARAQRTSSGSSGRGSASPASGKPVTITATIVNVAARPIENGGTKYAIEFDGWSERWASTFDEARGKFALENKGATVEARVVRRGKWWNCDELKVVTPAGGEVSEPEIPL